MKKTERFKCPTCGSSFFSSYGMTDRGLLGPPDSIRGRCKGPEVAGYANSRKTSYAGCTFTWSRMDDRKYFTKENQ